MSNPELINDELLFNDLLIEHRQFPMGRDVIVPLPAEVFTSAVKLEGPVYASVAEALDNPYFAGPSKQRIRFAVFNDQNSSSITMVNLRLAEGFQDETVRVGLIELANANPGRGFLVYDNLGCGGSQPAPRAMTKEIAKTGRFGDYAAVVLDGIGSVLRDHDSIRLVGRSQGGIVATEMAAQIVGGVETLVVGDPPATPTARKAFYRAFVEANHDKNLSFGARIKALKDNGQLGDDSGHKLFIDLPTGMAKGLYGEILAEALPSIGKRYVFLSPAQSELNHPDDMRAMVIGAIARASSSPPAVEQLVFEGTHNFGSANPALEAHALTFSRSDHGEIQTSELTTQQQLAKASTFPSL